MNTLRQSKARPRILCFVASYLPGYRSGGPIRTIVNFVDHLGDDFDIRIVTRDRDALDTAPYPGIAVDGWSPVGKAQVFYASEKTITLRGFARLLRETPHDLLYLNSYFEFGFTGLPLIARRLGLAPKMPCVLAPRGEFSAGAIALKTWKKRPYICLTRVLRLYSDLHWQASSLFEAEDIQRGLGSIATKIHVAPNLPPAVQPIIAQGATKARRERGPLKIVFLSRISPIKNLDFLLNALEKVTSRVHLTIYGPVGAASYWKQCQIHISSLPANVTVEYRGEVKPPQVLQAFSGSDLFVLPTLGENYGHVVLESLVAGTPVLLSDRTPWQASGDNAVAVLPLEKPLAWIEAIERWSHLSPQDLESTRSAALAYAQRYLDTTEALAQNKTLFEGALRS